MLYFILKRFFDILISLFGIIITLPLFFIIAIVVKINSSGPIFYKQERVGKDGKIFIMWKFRTMFNRDVSFSVEEIRQFEINGNDPRITRWGYILRKFALDELPQLFNIFVGEMSFVGPRPYFYPRIKENEKLKERLKVKPGLTSLAFIKGGVSLSEKDILMYDLEYIDRQNIWLDAVIFIKTINIYLKRLYEKKI